MMMMMMMMAHMVRILIHDLKDAISYTPCTCCHLRRLVFPSFLPTVGFVIQVHCPCIYCLIMM